MRSTVALRALHALRLGGVLDEGAIARRCATDPEVVGELMLDYEAVGWVNRIAFADLRGWALTDRGQREDDRRLREELDTAGSRAVVEDAHRRFEAHNAAVVAACTRWQLRPAHAGRFVTNTHDDPAWDARILDELADAAIDLGRLVADLGAALPRFNGYDERFAAALAHARAGSFDWVAGIDVDSCHKVWMELHADLLSTLGIERPAGG